MDEDLKGYMEWITLAEVMDGDSEGNSAITVIFFKCVMLFYLVLSDVIQKSTGTASLKFLTTLIYSPALLLLRKGTDSETDGLYQMEGINRVIYF